MTLRIEFNNGRVWEIRKESTIFPNAGDSPERPDEPSMVIHEPGDSNDPVFSLKEIKSISVREGV